MTLLQELGFTINIKKSVFEPILEPNFELNPDESVSPRTKGSRPDGIMSSNFINDISDSKVSSKSLREDEFLSLCSSSCPGAIQADMHQTIGKTNNFSKKLILSSEAKSEIQWWVANVRQWNGRPVL